MPQGTKLGQRWGPTRGFGGAGEPVNMLGHTRVAEFFVSYSTSLYSHIPSVLNVGFYNEVHQLSPSTAVHKLYIRFLLPHKQVTTNSAAYNHAHPLAHCSIDQK